MNFTTLFTSSLARKSALTLSLALALPVVIAQSANTHPVAAALLAHGPEGTAISVSDVLSELKSVSEAERKALFSRPDGVDQVIENLLLRRILAAEAQRDGLNKDPVIAAAIALARDRVLSIARLVQVDAQNTPGEAELEAKAQDMYKANAVLYSKPPRVRARHILLAKPGPESMEKAKELLAQLHAGASFEELAKTYSTDAGSAVRGGDLGFFTPSQVVQPIADALAAMTKPGELSEPVESQFGIHIIRFEERREKGIPPFDEVRTQIMAEARTATLNEKRIQMVEKNKKQIQFDRSTLDAFIKSEQHK